MAGGLTMDGIQAERTLEAFRRFDPKGVLDIRDVLFFAIFILAWLLASAVVIEIKKAN